MYIVDTFTTLLDNNGSVIVIRFLNQAIHCGSSEQSLITHNQLEYNGVEVHSRAKYIGGWQCVIARHPGTKNVFKIDIDWDGSFKFIWMRLLIKREKKKQPHIHLTTGSLYNPADPDVRNAVRRMSIHYNRAFNWSKPKE